MNVDIAFVTNVMEMMVNEHHKIPNKCVSLPCICANKMILQMSQGEVLNEQCSVRTAQRTLKQRGKNLKISELGILFVMNNAVNFGLAHSLE